MIDLSKGNGRESKISTRISSTELVKRLVLLIKGIANKRERDDQHKAQSRMKAAKSDIWVLAPKYVLIATPPPPRNTTRGTGS